MGVFTDSSQVPGPGPRGSADRTSFDQIALGLAQADLIDTNADHDPRTRTWARWFHDSLTACQGLTWMSRQDNSARAIMLFEGRAGMPGTLRAGRDAHRLLHTPDVLDTILELMERLELGDAGP